MNFIFLQNKDKMSFLWTGSSFIDEESNDVVQFKEYLKSKGGFKNLPDEEKKEIYSWMEKMTDDEADVFRLYFGIREEKSNTLLYLQERVNLSPERINEIKESILKNSDRKNINPENDQCVNNISEKQFWNSYLDSVNFNNLSDDKQTALIDYINTFSEEDAAVLRMAYGIENRSDLSKEELKSIKDNAIEILLKKHSDLEFNNEQ